MQKLSSESPMLRQIMAQMQQLINGYIDIVHRPAKEFKDLSSKHHPLAFAHLARPSPLQHMSNLDKINLPTHELPVRADKDYSKVCVYV